MINKTKQKTYILIGLIVIALAAIIYFGFLNKGVINITVTPKDARVLMNNAPEIVNNSGIAKSSHLAGKYTLKVEANGYIPYSENITLKGGSSFSKKIDLKALPVLTVLDENAYLVQKYADNQVAYLGDNKSTLYTVSAKLNDQGQTELESKKAMTPATFSNIDKMIFSADKQLAMVKIGTDLYMYDFNRYDILHQEMRKIGSNIGDAVWDPSESRIAYFYAPLDGERSLIFADILNQNPQRVLSLPEISNPILRWSDQGDQLLIIPRNTNSAQNKVYLFDVYARQLNTLTDFGDVLDAKFIDNDSKVLYFTATNSPSSPIKSEVSVMDIDGKNKTNLKIKAYSDQSYIQGEGKILFQTYLNGQEALVMMDYKNQEVAQLYFDRPKTFKINNLLLSSDSKIIYISTDNGLYSATYADNHY